MKKAEEAEEEAEEGSLERKKVLNMQKDSALELGRAFCWDSGLEPSRASWATDFPTKKGTRL